mgnify:CR=1 FL=1
MFSCCKKPQKQLFANPFFIIILGYIKGIKISNSFNYWGSCNTAGIIHLNWRLIFAPTKVLEYIIVHELCHLKEFNHTKNFWMLVEKFCPDYKNQILWLKKNDTYLYRIRFN